MLCKEAFPVGHPWIVWRKGISQFKYEKHHWPAKSDNEDTRLNKIGIYHVKILPTQDELFPPVPYRTQDRLHFTLCR